MTAISETYVPMTESVSPSLGDWARWAVLGFAFVVAGTVLGFVAAIRRPRLS